MTQLNGHQRLVRHRICLVIVSAGLTACAAFSFVRPDLHPATIPIGLALNLLWIWS